MKPLAWNGKYMREAFYAVLLLGVISVRGRTEDLPFAESKGQLISCVPADSY